MFFFLIWGGEKKEGPTAKRKHSFCNNASSILHPWKVHNHLSLQIRETQYPL